MRLSKVKIRNFGPFRGEHVLELDAKAYAVVAQRCGDPAKSNYVGKSSLLEAIDFALYGRHRHQLEDGWITRGEPDGYVELELVDRDGPIVRRERKRGKATRLIVGDARGDEAEKGVFLYVGLSAEDYVNTCYFQQRKMARFVLSDPGERMRVVSSWLQLAPLKRAEEILRGKVADVSQKASALRDAIMVSSAVEERELGGQTLADLKVQLSAVEASLAKATGRLENLRNLAGKNDRLLELSRAGREHEGLVMEADALAEQLGPAERGIQLAEDRDRAADAHARLSADRMLALRKSASSDKLARGEFDGVCPVAGIACPARDLINSQTAANAAAAQADALAAGKASDKMDVAATVLRGAEARLQEHQRIEERYKQADSRARRMLPMIEEAKVAPPPEDPAVLRDKVSTQHEVVANLTAKRESLRRSVDLVERAIAEEARMAEASAAVLAELATHRAAMVILGPQGAQRRVAEDALAQIQEGANQKLAECGIDLSVEVQWSREGQGLAAQCDSCGTMFPKSARAKACERCSAPRGPLLINRLEVVLSDRSGAAEDLAGLAVQFAASDWLRADRGSQWSVMAIDEPFSQLDAYHRGALGKHLASMLRGSYEQGLVVAHHTSLLDALPGRILVESDGKHSSLKVVA